MSARRQVELPWIGIIGGGQLGAMMADAARVLGFRVRVLDPSADCPARAACDELIIGAFDDVHAVAHTARGCHAVTVDLEKVGVPALEAAAQRAPVRPGPQVLAMVQDRIAQKTWLSQHDLPTAPWRPATNVAELEAALEEFGYDAFVKAAFGGYDGLGQVRVRSRADLDAARQLVAGQRCVVEQTVPFMAELSVQVARRPSGQTAVFPPALNHHVRQVLAWTLMPAPLPLSVAQQAEAIATRLATTLAIEGLLTVEMFLSQDGSLLVNELAPRPHNSFHTTLVGTATSQFEQAIRAAADLPLGRTDADGFTVVANLLGDLWMGEAAFPLASALEVPFTRVNLYGKTEARPGRKMGHVTTRGATAAEALERAATAMRSLGGALEEPAVPDLSIRAEAS